MWNLYNEKIKVIFNCPNTPAFNVIETVFGDMKYYIRKKNEKSPDGLVKRAREFLNTCDEEYMKKKIS